MVHEDDLANAINKIKGIYSDVLDVDIDDLNNGSDFFELGGSSLDTISLIVRIKQEFGIPLSQDVFFLNPKIMELSLRIKELQEETSSSQDFPELVALDESVESEKWFPASKGQEQMIALWECNGSMYNMMTTIEFTKEPIDVNILRKAFKFVVEQQPTLRTIVKTEENRFMQKVLPVSMADQCFELIIRSACNFEEVDSIAKNEAQYLFPLYDPPIVRGVVVKGMEGSDFFFLSQYHVGSDSWALVILRQQLLQAYMSIRSMGYVRDSLKSPSHPNFIDWTIWQRKCLHDFGQEERQLTYWRRKLENLPCLQLPLDKPRPSSLGSSGLQLPIKIHSSTIQKFTKVVTKHGANLYAGLLAVYMLLLHRLGGGDDFAIGIALANRNAHGLHNLIGYFANEVAVRAKFTDSTTFIALLQQVRENVLEGMANAEVPFHDVVNALNVARDSSRTPLFQAFYALQERKWWTLNDICPTNNENLHFELKNFSSHISKFEVHMFIREDELGGVEGDLTISTELFSHDTGKRLADTFQLLVETLVDNSQDVVPVSVSSYDVLTKADRQIIAKANNTKISSFPSQCRSIFNWACSSESAVALFYHSSSKNKIVTYRELKTMISSVRAYIAIKKRNENIGGQVGLLIKSSPEAVAAIYGVVASGCAIVVVDPEKTTVDKSRMIFEDSGVKLVIADSDFIHDFQSLKNDGFDLQSLGETFSETSCSDIPFTPEESDLNEIFGYFYTSGTTGRPKGAIITHGNVLNLVNWWKTFFELKQSDRVLLFSSLSFIMSLRQYLPTLCSGGTVVLPESNVEFESAIIGGRVNKLVCTPSALGVLDIQKVSCQIDAIQVAGEAPRLSVLSAWNENVEKIFIGLGPTELCAHALCGNFDGKTIAIGFPAANCKAYIVQPMSGCQAPINVIGELWVSGENVSHGYLNRPEITSFIEDPFEPGAGVRCYMTGDLAKRLQDGRIQFLGRADTQLKVNGFRIEAGEIINALPDDILSAHVMSQDGQLALYTTSEVSTCLIKETLESSLPAYMVPNRFFSVDGGFPLNKNRKVDVPNLMSIAKENLVEDPLELDDTRSVETKPLESIISAIWSRALNKPLATISPHSNFFELGGTSLTAVLVCRSLCEELKAGIAISDILVHPTVASLARFIEVAKGITVHSRYLRPLHFVPGGRRALHPQVFNFLQVLGLFLMSLVVFIPLIGTIFLCARSLTFFGNLGPALIPSILGGGCAFHIFLVYLCKMLFIGKYKEGKAVVYSWFFLKWWLIRRVMSTTRLYTWAFDETNISRYFLMIFGARVGSNFSMEQPYILEPDLLNIGDNCTVEFEVQFCTSQIENRVLELRSIDIGNNVKLGVRSVLLGGTKIHDDCEVAPKSLVDFYTSTTAENQYLIGSPAKIEEQEDPDEEAPETNSRDVLFTIYQIMCCTVIVGLFTACLYIGALIGTLLQEAFGNWIVVIYMASLFSYICGSTFLLLVVSLKWILLPNLEEGKLYSGCWFMLRMWFLDRLFLSPMYSLALSRSLETTSTYPMYLRSLGTKLGNKVWLAYLSLRVGMEFIHIEDGVHTGMQNYITTARKSKNSSISFHSVCIGKKSSSGQRAVIYSGAKLGTNATVGAETCVPANFVLEENGTVLGSPPVSFYTSKGNEEIIQESQLMSRHFKENPNHAARLIPTTFHTEESNSDAESTLMKNRLLNFSLYGLVMNIVQLFLPVTIIGPFIAVYFLLDILVFGGFHIMWLFVTIPATFFVGSIILMLLIKGLQLLFFRGPLSTGIVEYYSLKFMQWYILADLVYLCTSTIFVPFSGTELYCIWLRCMGSKIGKRVFISPENGGFRELDFLDVGDDCCILSPNLTSHYADHGKMQFCPVVLEKGCTINPGATIMPLTKYSENCIIGPFAVTTKGQHCEADTVYMGNPCKPSTTTIEKVAVLFNGLGSAYPGMFKDVDSFPTASAMLQKASDITGVDIMELCKIDTHSRKTMQEVKVAQLVVTVANLVSAEIMQLQSKLNKSRVQFVAGFSVGEFAALCFAGAISFEDTIKLVQVQSEEFHKIRCKVGAGTLCNVKGLPLKKVEKLCAQFHCAIANVICDEGNESSEYNIFVCGGLEDHIDQLVDFVNSSFTGNGKDIENEGERCPISAKKLQVGTPNHTKLMKPALAKFKSVLANTKIKMPENHILYSNVTGRPYTSVEEIRELLPLQMIKPVMWHSIVNNIHFNEGCSKFIECGATQTQSKIVKTILRNEDGIKVFSFDNNS